MLAKQLKDYLRITKRRPQRVSIKRKVMWFLGNIAIWVPAYYWLIGGNEYAKNYTVFMIWVHFLCSLVIFHKETCKKLQEKGPSVNMTFNLAVDCIFGIIMATFGFYLYAFLYIIGSMCQKGAYSPITKKEVQRDACETTERLS